MVIIGIIIIVLFAVLIGWTLNNLYNVTNVKAKIIFIIISTLLILLITFILFNISKSSIQYPNESMVKDVRNILVLTFAPVNGIVIIPFIAKQISRVKENSIEEDELKKKIILMSIIFILILILECMYLKNIQIGILKILENMK